MKGWLGSVLGGGRTKDATPAAAPVEPSPELARAARAEADAHWANRLDEAECRAALAAWERAAAADPGDPVAPGALARGYYFLAEMVYAPRRQAGERAATRPFLAALDAGAAAAERGLRASSPEFARLRGEGVAVHEAAAALGATEVLTAFWWTQATMLAAITHGVSHMVRQFNPVLKVMERVAVLKSDVWYGAPDRDLATVFCSAPGYAGGDLQKGRRHFEASLTYAPEFFDTRVAFAQLYARPAKDEALHVEQLTRVIETPVDVLPEVVPEQTLARQRAEAELARGFRGKR